MSTQQKSSNPWLKLLWLLIAISIFGAAVYWLLTNEEQKTITTNKELDLLPVSIIKVEPVPRKIKVSTSGMTRTYWNTTITAVVEGRISEIDKGLEPGKIISNKQLLLRLKSKSYQAQVDAAKSRLANAKLTLAREQAEKAVIIKTTRHLKSSFARRQPHIAAAQSDVKAAMSALNHAKQNLTDTRITAPFSSIILDRKVTPGQWVQVGTPLFDIASSESMDVLVELSPRLWNRIGHLKKGVKAKVITSEGIEWQASVRYLRPTRDKETHQRSLIVKVDKPYNGLNPLLADQYVRVEFNGKQQNNILGVPASALTNDGKVWTVNQQNQLELEEVERFDEGVDRIYIRFANESDKLRNIVIYPLDSMISGQKIAPKLVNEKVDAS